MEHPEKRPGRELRVLWIAQGVDPVQAATWSGHSKASMTLDVYAHVMIDPETSGGRFGAPRTSPDALPP
ncbi:MAG TPA: hypothetical protein VIU81_01425 [Gaiellaceae bacterium]